MNIKTGIFTILFFFFSLCPAGAEPVRITNGEWLPYHSKTLPHFGAGSRIVTESFNNVGIDVEWGFFPWKRGYKLVVKKEWDASIGWIRTPEREKEVLFSDPVYGGKWVLFHLKSVVFDWNTIDDLKQFRIGATANYSYGKQFDDAEKQKLIKVERVPRLEQNFSKLLGGRMKIMVHAVDSGYATLRAHFEPHEIDLITHHPKPIQVVDYHLVFSKTEQNKERLILFNKGLKQLREMGKIDKYIKEAWDQSK
ncbi:MAG: amino acid ABC transporter substrate-binding protein [Desulfobacteraceae bacterium]|nr:amino acid ABC transporter substrate-binding protein [Desulfobacteraceae bacterium]